MPCTDHPPRRPQSLLAFSTGCLLALAAAGAHANEPAASHEPPAARIEKADKPAVVRPLPSPVTPAAEIVKGPPDPMDMLKSRLSATFNTPRTKDGGSPREIAIASRPTAPTAPTAPAAPAGHETGLRPTAAEARAPVRRRAAVLPVADPATAAVHAHAGSGDAAAHWSYDGNEGPERWGAMKPEFSKCATGARQSPIDIKDGIRVDLEPVQFDYRPTPFRVVDNGHTVQVNVGPGNSIEVTGRRYELVQFHFHRPSEERINGRQFDMVVHLVHKSLEGRLAVVAVLLDRGPAHAVVQSVWNNLPLEKGDEVPARGSLDLAELLPAERAYFTYMGSLTTPPCSEGVLWMVMKAPMPISSAQIDIFSRLYPMNARPLQSASGRLIKQSN